MISSTIDYRRRVQRFHQDLNRLSFTFQPFRLFRYSFQDNSNSVSLHFGLPVSCLSCIGKDSSLADGLVETFELGMLILSDLEFPALPYVAPITAISRLPEY